MMQSYASIRPKVLVLSLAGGGIKGVIAAQFLAHLEKELGNDIGNVFDLYAGTSVGAILCGAYVYSDKSANELIKDVHHLGKDMMKPQFSWGGMKTMCDSQSKEKVIKEYVGEKSMISTEKNVMFVTYNVTKGTPIFFKSWLCSTKVKDVIDASSAAPGYYKPVNIGNDTYIDGGVAANYPSDCAYAEAIQLYGSNADIRVLSIGTGMNDDSDNDVKSWWGLIPWATKGNLIEVLFDGPQDTTHYRMNVFTKALGHQYLYINAPLVNTSMSDTSDENINTLCKIGTELWTKYKDEVMRLLK